MAFYYEQLNRQTGAHIGYISYEAGKPTGPDHPTIQIKEITQEAYRAAIEEEEGEEDNA